ncbi:hypothetical protein H6G27_10425 [Nostoc linckia FACHB-104]|nr:hypothetical protein [Nostoc linckia FACHB-104]
MQAETEKLLGTLEILCSNALIWETIYQGEFNLWNLIISQRLVNLTDIELAFEHWQNIEEWGTPTNQKEYGEYAPTRSEHKNNNWNQTIAAERQEYYQKIQHILTKNCQNLQAYSLSIPKSNHQNFEWGHPDFSVSILVAETKNNNWLCLAPTVPDQVSYNRRKTNPATTKIVREKSATLADESLISQLQSCLDNLTPIIIYGYYHGGYNYTYEHHLVGAYAKTKISAIELALQAAAMVMIEKPTVEYASDAYNSRKLSQFMNKCLSDRTLYTISFWDIGYTYEVGQTPAGDWIGVRSTSEFEYNP